MENISSKLYISHRNLQCDRVLQLLQKCQIASSVQSNQTIQCNKNTCWIEHGCQITINKHNKKKLNHLWKTLQSKENINCAYFKTHNFSGCILDYLRDTLCK